MVGNFLLREISPPPGGSGLARSKKNNGFLESRWVSGESAEMLLGVCFERVDGREVPMFYMSNCGFFLLFLGRKFGRGRGNMSSRLNCFVCEFSIAIKTAWKL